MGDLAGYRAALWRELAGVPIAVAPERLATDVTGLHGAKLLAAMLRPWPEPLARNHRLGDRIAAGWLRAYHGLVLEVFDGEPDVVIENVGERWAGMCVNLPVDVGPRARGAVLRAKVATRRTCQVCGAAGALNGERRWRRTRCAPQTGMRSSGATHRPRAGTVAEVTAHDAAARMPWPLHTIDFEAGSPESGTDRIEVGVCRWMLPGGLGVEQGARVMIEIGWHR